MQRRLSLLAILGASLMTLLLYSVLKVPGPVDGKIQKNYFFQNLNEAQSLVERKEKSYPHMRPDNEKKFFLFSPTGIAETGIVYIPGFSATRRELSPVVENLAQQLGANLFMSRLSGHGQTAEEFGTIRAENFLSDGFESLAISRVLGKRKIWIATSTGALVALWMAQNFPAEISALILVSPAFDLKPWESRLLAGYFGSYLGKALVGPYRQWTPLNSEQEKYWHIRYRTEGLTALTRLIAWVKEIDKSKIKTPVLIFYTPQDEIINLSTLHKAFMEIGSSQKKLVRISAKDHVLAGNVASPQTTSQVTQEMFTWLSSLK